MTRDRKDDIEALQPARKPYAKPKLEEYGKIADITRHIGNNSPKADPPPHASFFTTR